MLARMNFQLIVGAIGSEEPHGASFLVPFPFEIPETMADAMDELIIGLAKKFKDGCLVLSGRTEEEYVAKMTELMGPHEVAPDAVIALPDQSRVEPDGQDPRMKSLDIHSAIKQ